MIVRCRRDCYDNARFYERGKEYDIDPAAPIAKFFDFPVAAPKPVVSKPKGAGKSKDDFLT